jgi:hypothetical protein
MPHYGSRNVIYFPYINVPQSEWFMNILLYWDKIYSIAPYEYTTYPIKFEPYTRSLIQENLIQTIHPSEYISQIPNFVENFLTIIKREKNRDLISNNRKYRFLPVHKDKWDKVKFSWNNNIEVIHFEKLQNIGDELVKLGLAVEGQGRWYNVEYNTANIFMLYLSYELGKLEEIKSNPITDCSIDFPYTQLQIQDPSSLEVNLTNLRPIILRNILPSPRSHINIRDILSFKSRNQDELIHFRSELERQMITLAAIDDPIKRDQAIEYFIREVNADVTELTDRMKRKGLKTKFWTITAHSLAAAGIINSLHQGNLNSAILSSVELVRFINELKEKQFIKENYLAYAVYAKKSFFN